MPADSDLPGLTAAEVRVRVEAGQVNTLPSRSGRTTSSIVRANVFTRVNGILFVLFVIVLSTGSQSQGAFAFLIVANSIIGIVQELRAKRTLDNLAVVGEAHPVVVRDGQRQQIARDNVVLDDLIVVNPGDQIVVDGAVVVSEVGGTVLASCANAAGIASAAAMASARVSGLRMVFIGDSFGRRDAGASGAMQWVVRGSFRIGP